MFANVQNAVGTQLRLHFPSPSRPPDSTNQPSTLSHTLMILHIQKLSHHLWKGGTSMLPRVLYASNRERFAAAIPPSVKTGEGCLLGYSRLGNVINARTAIGHKVKIEQRTTTDRRASIFDVPVVEDGVEIGAGSCVLGPIKIGAGAVIGANAVVLCDVPSGMVAVGVPARIL
jgi:serine O-acetyltransferase